MNENWDDDQNPKDNLGLTPLHYAASRGQLERNN